MAVAALAITRKIGQVCAKHPELGGERLRSNSDCPKCATERRARIHAERMASDPDYVKRHYQRKAKCNMRRYAQDAEYRERHIKDGTARKVRRYAEDEQYRVKIRARAAGRTNRPAWADMEAIAKVYAEAKRLGMQVDHIIPLNGETVSGLHVHANLQLLTRAENRAKSNKFDPSVLREHGGHL